MKKFYTFAVLLLFVFLSSCSKDFLKRYDRRIVGTWRITDVNRIGLGGNLERLRFTSGTLTFDDDGSLTYVDLANNVYRGEWDISQRVIDDEKVQRLEITAIDFNTQQIRTKYYDDMTFLGTDHFKASIMSTFATYVTHFRR